MKKCTNAKQTKMKHANIHKCTNAIKRCAHQAGPLSSLASTHSGTNMIYHVISYHIIIYHHISSYQNIMSTRPFLSRYGLQRGYGDFIPNGLPTSLKLLPQVFSPSSSYLFAECCQNAYQNPQFLQNFLSTWRNKATPTTC